MAKYNIFNYNGEKHIFVKVVDDREVDIDEEVKKLNKDTPEDESIHGLGYYAVKQESI